MKTNWLRITKRTVIIKGTRACRGIINMVRINRMWQVNKWGCIIPNRSTICIRQLGQTISKNLNNPETSACLAPTGFLPKKSPEHIPAHPITSYIAKTTPKWAKQSWEKVSPVYIITRDSLERRFLMRASNPRNLPQSNTTSTTPTSSNAKQKGQLKPIQKMCLRFTMRQASGFAGIFPNTRMRLL